MPALGQKGKATEIAAEQERWRVFQEEQAKRTAAEVARRQHEQEKALYAEAWSISLAVCDEVVAAGDTEDDEGQAEARRRQRLMAYKGRYLEIISELRGLDYRAGRAGVIDIALPEALWGVPLAAEHDGMGDVLPRKPRSATEKATAAARRRAVRVTDEEAARLRREVDENHAAWLARQGG